MEKDQRWFVPSLTRALLFETRAAIQGQVKAGLASAPVMSRIVETELDTASVVSLALIHVWKTNENWNKYDIINMMVKTHEGPFHINDLLSGKSVWPKRWPLLKSFQLVFTWYAPTQSTGYSESINGLPYWRCCFVWRKRLTTLYIMHCI